MIDEYFDLNAHRTDLAFTFYYITNKKTIDVKFIDNLKDNLLTSYRPVDQFKFLVKDLTEAKIKSYVLDYVVPKDVTQIDLNVRQGDWGEVFAALMVAHFQGLDIPINKLQWKINKDKSVFGTDLIAFNSGEKIQDIHYYEIKTRVASHKKEGKAPNYNYISILAHNSLLNDQNAPNELIADFLSKLFYERREYEIASRFIDIVQNPSNYNRKFELFFIVEKNNYTESIFEELHNLPPQLTPLRVTVVIIEDLQKLIQETWSDIQDRAINIVKT